MTVPCSTVCQLGTVSICTGEPSVWELSGDRGLEASFPPNAGLSSGCLDFLTAWGLASKSKCPKRMTQKCVTFL